LPVIPPSHAGLWYAYDWHSQADASTIDLPSTRPTAEQIADVQTQYSGQWFSLDMVVYVAPQFEGDVSGALQTVGEFYNNYGININWRLGEFDSSQDFSTVTIASESGRPQDHPGLVWFSETFPTVRSLFWLTILTLAHPLFLAQMW
jgi:hypothetical protein